MSKKTVKSRAQSPAMKMLLHVWKNQSHQKRPSCDNLNHAMHAALSLAVRYSLRFNVDDFRRIATDFRFGYWGGNNGHMLGEFFYALACGSERGLHNMSASLAFERWRDRKPFIVRPFDTKQGARLYVGAQFTWYHSKVLNCTSFAEDGDSLTACGYEWSKERNCETCGGSVEYSSKKLVSRHKITHDAIREFHTAQKRHQGLGAKVADMRMNDAGCVATIKAARGTDDPERWRGAPLTTKQLDAVEAAIAKVENKRKAD